MERIALISDIHGNLPALEAVLQDIKQRSITRVFCLGDMVGKGPYPRQTIDICRETCELVIMGNWEEAVNQNASHEFIQWQRRRLDAARLDYLSGLPNCIDFCFSGKNVRLYHASHISSMSRIQRNAPDQVHLAMFGNTDFTGYGFAPDIVGYADIHIVFLKQLQDKLLFNVGSVGNPLDYPQASYAIIEGAFNSVKEAAFSIDIVRVPYDIELAVEQAEKEGPPELSRYTAELRTATYGGDPALHQ